MILSGLLDYTFLLTPEAFRAQAQPTSSAVELRQMAFNNFLSQMSSVAELPYALCVRPEDCVHAASYLAETNRSSVLLCSVVGFPDGSWCDTEYKCQEAAYALSCGASEVDMVINTHAAKEGDWATVESDVRKVTECVQSRGGKIKVILETAELSLEQVQRACVIADALGADFVKTSTGFGRGGASVDALEVMQEAFSGGIKISGGVTDDNVADFVEAAMKNGKRDLKPSEIRIGASRLLESELSTGGLARD